jgi:hypothetical protein
MGSKILIKQPKQYWHALPAIFMFFAKGGDSGSKI